MRSTSGSVIHSFVHNFFTETLWQIFLDFSCIGFVHEAAEKEHQRAAEAFLKNGEKFWVCAIMRFTKKKKKVWSFLTLTQPALNRSEEVSNKVHSFS